MPFDQIDGAAQLKLRTDSRSVASAVLVSTSGVVETKRELEPLWGPLFAFDRENLEPDLEIPGHRGDFVAPHAIDGGRQLLPGFALHISDRPLEQLLRLRQCLFRERK